MSITDIKRGFGLRLRRFREREGFSLAELRAKMHNTLSRQAISKYENGLSLPNSTNLLQLCEVLNVQPDDLLNGSPRTLESVEFRRLSKFTASDQRKLRGSLELEFERMHELHADIGIKASFEPPLENFGKISTAEMAEEAANKLRKVWNLGQDAIPSVVELLESRGILVHIESTSKSFYGVSGRSGDFPVVVLNDHPSVTDLVRMRFTAAHELGHLVMQIEESLPNKMQEKLCHRFAGAFLMPSETLKMELGADKRRQLLPSELLKLKERYGLSIAALYHRAYQVGLISEGQLKKAMIDYRSARWHRNEPGHYIGKEKPALFEQHLLHALAEEFITISKAAALAKCRISDIRQRMTIGKAPV